MWRRSTGVRRLLGIALPGTFLLACLGAGAQEPARGYSPYQGGTPIRVTQGTAGGGVPLAGPVVIDSPRVTASPTLSPGTPLPPGVVASSLPCEGGACPLPCGEEFCGPPGRLWVRGEYLLWWTKGSPLPPLLTTSPVGTPLTSAGVPGEPGTSVLFGDSRVNDGVRSGGRVTAGYWINASQTTGIEGNFFGLENLNAGYSITSTGIPIVARPFQDPNGAPNALLVAFPGLVAGSADIVSSSTNVLGAEANVRQNLACGCCYRVDALVGYRFLGMDDGLDIRETEIDRVVGSPTFGSQIDLTDSFRARNRFHGGQVGVEAEFRRGAFYVDVLAKLALGATSTTIDIQGTTQVVGQAAVPGGFLALPTNSGRFSDTAFAVVPEVGLTLGYQVTSYLRAFAGYTFIYWSEVARAGNQVDLAVNQSQLPPGTLVGPARPAFVLNRDDFWMHGLNFGLELRY